MMQSRLMSFVEAAVNVAVGYVVAVLMQVAAFPLLGLEASFSDNLLLGLIFTGVSMVRSYALRRLFNMRILNAKPAERSGPACHRPSAP